MKNLKSSRIYLFLILLSGIIGIISCSKGKNPEILTSKIEYDVSIKAENSDNTDWWVQNLEGPVRDKLVNALLEGAKSGKFKVYDYSNNLLEGKDLEQIFRQEVSYTVPSISDPETDSIVTAANEIDKRDITKIIFLEEWYFDEKNLTFTKKVLGLGPVIKKYTTDKETGEQILKGYMPLFWIYLDNSYPEKLKK